MNTKIGFIGLGNMGTPMAKNLLNAGYHLQVYNRTLSKIDELGEGAITKCHSPAEAADGVSFIITMLSEDEVLKETVLGENGILKKLPKGAIHISMSTISPDTAQLLSDAHKAAGSNYLASPVFGRPEAAAAKKLWVCVSGDQHAKDLAKPVLENLGQGVIDFGEGAGANVVKVAGNFMILASMEIMAEAYTLAEKSGVDRVKVAEFFGSTLFNAPIFQNYGKLIANKQYEPVGFKSKLGYKDARLALKLSQLSETPMPVVTTVHNRLLSAVAKGWGETDWVEGVGRGVCEDAGV
ncbi:MAG TPA: NAD(P)-dependent oxidoreductase [Mucilaginibacter sp.]|jgi:3-hydroxyisobutyrate dehydrogenase-like beta-hydroxyacid dehydrogenase|nr:NAD(P)-dependent oxidoreductase [Mucilaginibacter sp.]